MFVEYGPVGGLLIPAFCLVLQRPAVLTALPLLSALVTLNGAHTSSLGALLVMPVIYAVNTLKVPRLPRSKWFFYSFYPLHLVILWLVKSAL